MAISTILPSQIDGDSFEWLLELEFKLAGMGIAKGASRFRFLIGSWDT